MSSGSRTITLHDADLDDILDTVDLPQVDIEKLSRKIEQELDSEAESAQETMEYQYQVVVDCKDEDEQLELIEKLEKQKYTCRATGIIVARQKSTKKRGRG